MTSETQALLERLDQEPILDGGDGPMVELWEADFRALLALAHDHETLIKERDRMAEALQRMADPRNIHFAGDAQALAKMTLASLNLEGK